MEKMNDDEIERLKEERDAYQQAYAALLNHNISKAPRELSDEEIKSEAQYFCHSWHSQNPERLVLFARAILKKASEK